MLLFLADAEPQMGISTVIQIIEGLATIAVGGWVFAIRNAYGDARAELIALKNENKEIDRRLHADEIQTTKQQGVIDLLRQTHDTSSDAIEEIKRNMVTRAEYEAHSAAHRGLLEQILARSGSGGNYRAVTLPRPEPPITPPPPRPRGSRPGEGDPHR